MADLRVNFCGIPFKNPIVVSSIETSDSLDHITKAIDSGVGGVVIKTITDKPKMSELTRHSKYAILNDKGEIIKGKVPRFFVFYARSGYSVKRPRNGPQSSRRRRNTRTPRTLGL